MLPLTLQNVLRIAALRNWLSATPHCPLREGVIELIEGIATASSVRCTIGGP
jgi:hypothetical protein